VGAVLLLLVIAVNIAMSIYGEWLWFEALGFVNVYRTILFTQVWLFLVIFLIFLVIALINIIVARRFAPPSDQSLVIAGRMVNLKRIIFWGMVIWCFIFAIIFGQGAADEWQTFLRYQNATPFGITDPIFEQDASFYVFTLPVFRIIQSWGRNALLVIALGVVAFYAFHGIDISTQRFRFPVTPAIKAHLSALGAGVLALFAVNYWLDIFELVLSPRGIIFGAGYTDVNAQLFALRLLMAIAAISAVLLLANIFLRGLWLPALGVGVWIVAFVLVGTLYPMFVQRFQVEPNELARETPYITNNIRMTRWAYGLDRIEEKFFPADPAVSLQEVKDNPETMDNIRIWDHRPLKDTYNQIQAIRLYYEFNDIDVDRYQLDGHYRQVMLSAREMIPEKVAAEAQTWVNQRLQYTHGYGLALNQVKEITGEGLPKLLIKDVPPVGDIDITRPEIYYGERTDSFVFVNTMEDEFDYPKGDENVFTKYEGETGIVLDSYIKRLTFATILRDVNILISSQLIDGSRLLLYRNIRERVNHIAPFLALDEDPYIVTVDGKLYWIQDAYTTTTRFPYSQPYQGAFNYVRNSVKVVIDAYDGSVVFYIFEPEDAIVQTYASIFPDLFKPADDMPEELRKHVRYPQDVFEVQARMFATYHMQDPRVFYNKEDVWVFPNEVFEEEQLEMEPYYVIIRLPDEEQEEFLLMLPFTPTAKDNTIGWLAGRSDGDDYGKLLAYKFPKEKLIYGPLQIEARIDQDDFISQQISLWSQSGSHVIRGNLLMIPIADSFLYAEPLYLQAEQGKIPELKRIIVATGERIAMEETLEEGLASILGGATTAPPPEVTPPDETPPAEGSAAELALAAEQHYLNAKAALRVGDWATYGKELDAMESVLSRLIELTNPTPIPSPEQTPTPPPVS
jgi:hypothetical protein